MKNSITQMRSVSGMKAFPPRAIRGFTLIEMIAAFVIFAIAVGALMQILTMSMNNARRSADETRAALWAQSLLDTVGVGERVEAGSSHGKFDDKYHWELQIDQIDPQLVVADVTQNNASTNTPQPLAQAGGQMFELPQIDLFHVVLTVAWGDNARERSAQFSTLRTATTDTTRSQGFAGGDLRRAQPGQPMMQRQQQSPEGRVKR